MIHGAHAIVYSTDAEADRAFFRDVLELDWVDVGGGWLIFALPPSEVAFHPSDANGSHELYLMCDDLGQLLSRMERHGVPCSEVEDHPWGRLTRMTLPGGGQLGVYEPRHPRPGHAGS
jgi:hypothetical protein